MDRIIVWDDPEHPEGNAYHLLIENAHRRFSKEDVAHVINHPDTYVEAQPTGYDIYLGPAPDGKRTLVVVAMGEREIYPKTAYEVADVRRYRP